MFKRTILLCLSLICLLVSVASAGSKPIDETRWYWVTSNSQTGVYIDKQNIEYDPATDSVNLWVMYYTPTEELTWLEKTQISYTENTMTMFKHYTYTKDSQFPTEVIDRTVTDEIVPGTFGESIRDVSLTLINRDEQLAEYKKQQDEASKKAVEEQEKQENDQRNEEITRAAIGIIGGLF